jgi:hypothetical protein
MTPDKALNLVKRYAFLTHAIKGCKQRIGDCLDCCPEHGGHLGDWYMRPDPAQIDEYGRIEIAEGEWLTPGPEQAEECRACYEAHVIVQERKAMRRQLSYIKGAMTKTYDGTLPSAL